MCGACSKEVAAPGIAVVVVTPDTVAIYVGQTRTFAAIALDTRGDTVTGKAVAWTTTDSLIASVSPVGLLTAHNAGAVDVEATLAGVHGIAQVTVNLVPVAQVIVSPAVETLFVSHAFHFAVMAKDSAGNTLTNPTVASVNGSGIATAHDSGGAWIRASIEGHSDSAQLAVEFAPVATLLLMPGGDTIGVTDSTQLTATLRDTGGVPLTGRTVTWASSDSAKATVSSAGMVVALDTGGVLVTGTSEGKADTATFSILTCTASKTVGTSGWGIRTMAGQLPPTSGTSGGGFFHTVEVLFGGGVLYGTSGSNLVLGYDVATLGADLTPGRVCLVPAAAGVQHTYAKVIPSNGAPSGSATVRQETFSFTAASDTGYVLLRYTFSTVGSASVSGFYAGLVADWDLHFDVSATDDVIRWDGGLTAGEAVEQDTAAHPQIVAIVPIAASGTQRFRGWLSASDPTDHAGYFGLLSGALVTATQGPGDIRALAGIGPRTLMPGTPTVIYFAIVGGATRAAFNHNLAAARATAAAIGY
jgi:uncharacterized protein YjdB